MNKVILMGRLTRDPEVRYSQGDSQMAIARFSLAVDRRFKKQGDTVTADFFNCTAFGKQGEFVEKYLKQGIKILLTGHIQNDNYTNKEGQKVYAIQIIVEELEFAESKSSQASNDNSQPSQAEADDEGFMNIPDSIDSTLPFA
jgi:single-strand binding protein